MHRSITVSIQAPGSNYYISIREVRETSNDMFVLASVGTKGGGGTTMITTISDTVTVNAGDKRVRQFILGKTWGWGDANEGYINSHDDLPTEWRTAKLLFCASSPNPCQGNQGGPATYIVMFRDDLKATYKQEAQNLISTYHLPAATKYFDFIGAFVIQLTPDQREAIAKLPQVKSVEMDSQVSTLV